MSCAFNIASVCNATPRMPVPNRHVQGPGRHHHPVPTKPR